MINIVNNWEIIIFQERYSILINESDHLNNHDETEYKKILNEYKKREKKYKEISEKFKFLTNEIADVLMQVSLTGKIKYINPACERVAGFKPEEVIGKRFTVFAPKKEWPKYFKKIKLMLDGKIVTNFVTMVIHKNGNIIPVEFSGCKSKNGKYFNAVMRDISERTKSSKRYRLLFENSECPITYLDINGTVLLVNDLGAKNLNGKPDELIGQSIYDLLPEFADEQKNRNKIILKTGKGLTREDKIILPSGEKLCFHSNLQPIKDEKNEIIGIQIVSLDITKRKKIEDDLKNIYKNASEGICVLDSKNKILSINPKAMEILGIKHHKDIKTFNIMNIVHQDDRDKLKERRQIRDSGKKISPILEARIINENGSIRWIEYTMVKIQWDNKQAYLAIFNDKTKLIKSELETLNSKKHLEKILNSTSELIFTIDSDYKINIWNKTIENITGIKRKDILNKNISYQDFIIHPSIITDFIKNIFNNKPAILNEIEIKTKYFSKRLLNISTSYLTDETGKINEILFLCTDITHEIGVDRKLKFGKSYVIQDNSIDSTLKMTSKFLKDYNQLLIITRSINYKFNYELIKKNIEYNILSKNKQKIPTISSLEELKNIILQSIQKSKNKIIIIDRIEYLIANYSFELLIKTLYDINDYIREYEAILIIRINPSLFNQNQILILNEEFENIQMSKISDIIIDRDLFDILSFIYNENKNNISVNYSRVGKRFSLSKITVKRRIESLIEKELIITEKLGKSKKLYLTKKAKILLHKRKEE